MDSFEDLLDFSGGLADSVEAVNHPEPDIGDQSHTAQITLPDGLCKRKHSAEREISSESDHHKSPKTRHLKPPANSKFACPFFKKDPSKFTHRQACSGPGFSSISRVKEHVYRTHKEPAYQCIRCYTAFGSRDLLEEHQRAEVPCKKSVKNVSDLINNDQYVRLRRKPSGQKTDVERWEEIYRIVFPKASVTPSCYYESQNVVTPAPNTYPLGSKQMENALVAGIRKDLYDCFVQVDEDLKAGFLNMVQKRVEFTIQEFVDKNNISAPIELPILATPADSPIALNLESSTYELGTNPAFEFQMLDPAMDDFALNGQELCSYDNDDSTLKLQDLTT